MFHQQQATDNYIWDGNVHDRDPNSHQSYTDNYGRRCRIVCDSSPRPPHQPPNPSHISRLILYKTMYQALIIYPNIREYIKDGVRLIVTQEYRPDRINVATRNGIIVRIVGFF